MSKNRCFKIKQCKESRTKLNAICRRKTTKRKVDEGSCDREDEIENVDLDRVQDRGSRIVGARMQPDEAKPTKRKFSIAK